MNKLTLKFLTKTPWKLAYLQVAYFSWYFGLACQVYIHTYFKDKYYSWCYTWINQYSFGAAFWSLKFSVYPWVYTVHMCTKSRFPNPWAASHYWAMAYFEPGHTRGGPVHMLTCWVACVPTCCSHGTVPLSPPPGRQATKNWVPLN